MTERQAERYVVIRDIWWSEETRTESGQRDEDRETRTESGQRDEDRERTERQGHRDVLIREGNEDRETRIER